MADENDERIFDVKGLGELLKSIIDLLTKTVTTGDKVDTDLPEIKSSKKDRGEKKKPAELVGESKVGKNVKAVSKLKKKIKSATKELEGKDVVDDSRSKCEKAAFIAKSLRDYIIEQVDGGRIPMKDNTPFKNLVLNKNSRPYANSDFWDFLEIEKQLNCVHILYWSEVRFRETTPATIVKMFDGRGYVESFTDSYLTKKRAKWFWTNVFKAIPAKTKAERQEVFYKIKNVDGNELRFTTAKREFFSGPVKRFARRYEKDSGVSISYDETTQKVFVSVR